MDSISKCCQQPTNIARKTSLACMEGCIKGSCVCTREILLALCIWGFKCGNSAQRELAFTSKTGNLLCIFHFDTVTLFFFPNNKMNPKTLVYK